MIHLTTQSKNEEEESEITFTLLRHRRRAGKEEKIEIRVVSGETNLILHSLHKANVFTLLKYL